MQLKDVNLTAEQVKDLCTKYMIETYERFPFVLVVQKECIFMMKTTTPTWISTGGLQ
jgi:hypothetical protein